MFQILARSNLVHEFILVSVHSRQLANMIEGVQYTVGKLKCVNIAKTILHLCIDYQLGEFKNLAHEMECISKARLLALLGGQSLDWFQIEVVVQVKIVEIFATNQQIQHVVSLTCHLQR